MGSGYLACILACILAFYLTILGCEAGGYSYFAAFVHNELRPYFIEHKMETQSNDAHMVFAYLVVSAVITWCSFLSTVLILCCGGRKHNLDEHEHSSRTCRSSLKAFVSCCCMAVLLVLAVLTTQRAWGWWDYFDTNNLGRLASHCHGLVGMIIAILIITMISLLSTTLLYACDSEPLFRS
ncbi:hypothetical protein F4774DRAFT_379404, partial [Daldinia eschscholtzii]